MTDPYKEHRKQRKIVDIVVVEEEEPTNRKTKIQKLKEENKRLTNEKSEAKEIINEFIRISAASTEEFEPEFFELIKRAEDFVNKE